MKSVISPSGRQRYSFIEKARRDQIVEAATETVAEMGYGKASLARIAERAGISKSVISYHFTGRGEVMVQVVSRFFDNTWEYMSERVEAETTAAGRIRAYIESQLEYFSANRSGFLAMVEIVDNYRGPDGSRPFAEAEEEELEYLTEILSAGQAAGEFREFDPRSVGLIVIQSVEGALGRWMMDASIDLTEQTSVLTDFIQHAIGREVA